MAYYYRSFYGNVFYSIKYILPPVNKAQKEVYMMKKIMTSLLTTSAILSATPEAIVFDFGGVMTKEPNRESVVLFLCNSFELSREEFETINREKRNAVKTGKRDQDFWIEYANKKNIALPQNWENSFNLVMKEAIGINHQMYDLVFELKRKEIIVALLSNIDDRLAKIIKEFDLYAPFTPCLLSCEVGLEKPDPKIYQLLLQEINMPANQMLFIDDKKENIDAALKLGFDAILFSSQDQLEKDLQLRGISID